MSSLHPNIPNTMKQNTHHSLFTYIFLFFSIKFALRIYNHIDFSSSGRSKSKAALFLYILLTFTTLFRYLWFYFFSFSDVYYVPISNRIIYDYGSNICLSSQIITSLGNASLFLIFILLICYWCQILRNTSTNNDSNIALNSSHHSNNSPRPRTSSFLESITNDEFDATDAQYLIPHSNNRYLSDISHSARYLEETDISTEPNFYFCIVILIVIYLINLFLFMTRVINSQLMLLYDTALSLLVCLVTVIALNKYSWRVRNLLLEFGTVSNAIYTYNNIQRILVITYISTAFLLIKLLIELAFLVNVGLLLSGGSCVLLLLSYNTRINLLYFICTMYFS